FLINKILHKKYSQYLSLILPCLSSIFYFMLIMGGISFKSIDPQYYEFKRLCYLNAGKIIVGTPTEDYNDVKYIIHKQILSRVKEISFQKITNNQVEFYINNTYFYYNYGIFLKGDAGIGWGIDFRRKILQCSNI
ncbi:hypothetical protein CQA53_11665, partial [Helicobacter didelphidarum]